MMRTAYSRLGLYEAAVHDIKWIRSLDVAYLCHIMEEITAENKLCDGVFDPISWLQ